MLIFKYKISSSDLNEEISIALNGVDYCRLNSTSNLSEVIRYICFDIQEVYIRNSHLLSSSQINQLKEQSDRGTLIVCEGIKSNFKTVLFEGSKRLFEVADKLEEVEEFCSCGRKACFGARVNEYNKVITFGNFEAGGNKPMCMSCYNDNILFKNKSYTNKSVMKSFLENEVYLNDLVTRLKKLHKEDRGCLLHEVICADYYLDRLLTVCDDVSFLKKLSILKQKFEDVLQTATAHDLLVAQKRYIRSK